VNETSIFNWFYSGIVQVGVTHQGSFSLEGKIVGSQAQFHISRFIVSLNWSIFITGCRKVLPWRWNQWNLSFWVWPFHRCRHSTFFKTVRIPQESIVLTSNSTESCSYRTDVSNIWRPHTESTYRTNPKDFVRKGSLGFNPTSELMVFSWKSLYIS